MSGGAYDYAFNRAEEFARSLLDTLPTDPAHDKDTDWYWAVESGYTTGELRRAFCAHLVLVAAAMRAIEWNDSGDGAPDEGTLLRQCLGRT